MKAVGILAFAVAIVLCSGSTPGVSADFDSAVVNKYGSSSKQLRGVDNFATEQGAGALLAQESGELDAATVIATKLRFVNKLQDDANQFVSNVKDWLTSVVRDTPKSEVVLGTDFSLDTKGDFDLDTPCGSLTAYKTFDVIKQFLNDPKYATLDGKAAENIMWHPSKDCMGRKNSVEVGGGSHVEFVAMCGNELLLNVSSANGGVTKTVFFKTVETTGAFVAVDFFREKIQAVGATGRLISNLKLRSIPDNVDRLLKSWRSAVRECAMQNTLEITGVVGGGWKQKYSKYGGLAGAFDTYVLGYAESFKIRYQSLDIPTKAPVIKGPVTEAPVTLAPVTKAPVTEAPATKAPATEAPATKAPATEAPATKAPATEAPVTKAPVTEAPATETPSTEAPATEAPTIEVPADEPITVTPAPEVPATEEPVTETPASEEPISSDEPVTETPAAETPVSDEPASEEPASAKPVSDEPTSDEPVTETPVAKIPASEEPVSEAPNSDEPAIETPAPEEPVSGESASEEPTSEEPATETPVAETPASDEPTSETPNSNEPTSDEPASEAPVSDEPTSETPTSDEPVTETSAADTPASDEPVTDAPADTTPTTETPVDGATTEPTTDATETPTDAPSADPFEPLLFDPSSTTAPPADTTEDPNAASPFAFSRVVDLDLAISELKALSDGTASMYMQAGVECESKASSESGCFMNTAMSKVLHGRFGSASLGMSVPTNESSSLPSTHSLASFVGLGCLLAVLIAFAAKHTKTRRRHGYAAIPSEIEPINAEAI